jgi:hypothetical protein
MVNVLEGPGGGGAEGRGVDGVEVGLDYVLGRYERLEREVEIS